MYPIRLTGSRIALREFRVEDSEAALRVVGDDRVTKWLSFDSRDEAATIKMIRGIVERAGEEPRQEYYLAATLAEQDEQLVGFARLGLGGVRAGKLGYAIAADEWGRGYATEAVRLLVDFGFQQLECHRISAAIGPDNAPSIAVIRKLGFVYEGRLRDHVHTNGAWRDSLLYSLLEHEHRTVVQ